MGEEEYAADARVAGDHEQELEHPAVVSAPPGVRPQLGGEHLEERHVQEGAAGDALEEPVRGQENKGVWRYYLSNHVLPSSNLNLTVYSKYFISQIEVSYSVINRT